MIVLLILGAYLLGSSPVGVLVGGAFGFDPRAIGSGNIGMTNVARSGGKRAAALTCGGDLLKGLIPVAAIRLQGFPPLVLAMVGFAAFVGSITSIFLLFKGGRGVSTSVGVWLGLAPLPIGISILVFLVMLATTRIVSLASISPALPLPTPGAAGGWPRPYLLMANLTSALVLLA